jgi:hypothetical protein
MTEEIKPNTRKKSIIDENELGLPMNEFKSPVVENTGKSILWVDDENFILPNEKKLRTRGNVIVSETGELTQKQWERRRIQDWGVLSANGAVNVRVFPDKQSEVQYFEFKDKETKRLEDAEAMRHRVEEARKATLVR